MAIFYLPNGVYPVTPTPLLENGSLDIQGLKACLDFYLDSKAAGVTILGSGGELPYLSDIEQHEIAINTATHINSSKPIIAGVNAFSQHHALTKIEKIQDHVDAIMLLMHSYYNVEFNVLKSAIREIAECSALPIIYYHFPQVSGLWLSPTEIVSLMEIDNVIGIKDSSLNTNAAKKILSSGSCFNYFTALSLFLPRLYPLGVKKAICPLAAISPEIADNVYKACLSSSTVETSPEFASLTELLSIASSPYKRGKSLWRLLKIASNLPISLLKKAPSSHAATKEALRLQGVSLHAYTRSPLPILPTSASEAIKTALQRARVGMKE